jgi:hypothetical protein
MNHIRRFATLLAVPAGAVLAFAAAAPPALATMPPPDPGGPAVVPRRACTPWWPVACPTGRSPDRGRSGTGRRRAGGARRPDPAARRHLSAPGA